MSKPPDDRLIIADMCDAIVGFGVSGDFNTWRLINLLFVFLSLSEIPMAISPNPNGTSHYPAIGHGLVAPPGSSGIHVIIVGSGFAGLACAIECTRKGHTVLVLDKVRELQPLGGLGAFRVVLLSSLN